MSSGTMLVTETAEGKGTVGGLCACAAEHSWVSKRVQEPAVTLSSAVQPRITSGVGGRIDHKCRFLLA